MVNLNSPTMVNVESNVNGKCSDLVDECNNLIWTMKAVDYMNEENQENLSRVHVLCCDKCDFLTISLKALQQHMTLLHLIPGSDFNNLTIYSCQECKCVSTELKLIQEHIKIFHNVSTENSSISEKIVNNKTAILTPSLVRNCRKPNHLKLVKTQLKMRKKLLQRKSLKVKLNNFLASDIDVENNNSNDCSAIKHEIKSENMHHNNEFDMSQDIDENDPLDMSINSTTCPFKGTKCEPTDCHDYPYSWKKEPVANDNYENSISNSINNNPLLSNPQTCIELIKLTLNQMLNKTSDQNRLSHLGFNPTPFLQTQFQLSPNIVPLLLPTISQVQNCNQNQPQNDMSFASKNLEIETIIANIQQQNLLKSSSPKSFEQNNHMISYQQSPIFLNHKMTGSSSNISAGSYIDNGQKNGNLTSNLKLSPLYNSKKSTDYPNKLSNKRGLKKQSVPTKVRNGLNDESGYLQNSKNFESPKVENLSNENLFNRSFLDTSEMDMTTDHIDFAKVLDGHDNLDSHTNLSNKSSPNTNDKPHRQNFTSQQNRILSDWFFTHCDKPYPSTEDTKDLSQISGLTYSQVKKWFANKRARSSLNKKNHKSYCLINPNDSTMEEMGNNDLLSISPSSESHRSYTNQIDAPTAIDFTTYNQGETEIQEN